MQIHISIGRTYENKKTTPSVSARGRQEMECRKILYSFFFLLG
jgi:hypothetical protein